MKKILILAGVLLSLAGKSQVQNALIDTTINGYHIQITMQPESQIQRSYIGDSLTTCTLTMSCYIDSNKRVLPVEGGVFIISATAAEIRVWQEGKTFKTSYEADMDLYPLLMQKAFLQIDFAHIEKYIGYKNK